MNARAHVARIDPSNEQSLHDKVGEALESIGIGQLISASSRIVLKPNFTYPFHKPGVTTSPVFIEATLAVLRQWTSRITIVESNGGAHAWQAEQAFEGHRLPEICARFDARYANMTRMPREVATTEILGREVRVELASPVLHECDLFITMPVPKVHVMTGVSLAFKNQWGCLPDVKRLRNHPDFAYKVLAINKLLRTRIALFDGTYFLDRTGPMSGDAIPMNLIVAANDPGVGSRVLCDIMGIDPSRIPHKKLALRAGMFPPSLESVTLNADLAEFRARQFRLERTRLNYLTLAAFHSRIATWFIYDSVFAKPVHEVLYLIRGRPKDMSPYW